MKPCSTSLFPIIYGPTASGKSAAAIAVVQALAKVGRNAEIVTADAMQVYRGMDIGTAKPNLEERAGIVHHLIDVADPHAPEPFTLEDWLTRCNALIDDLRAKGVIPVVVGGTSLYVQSLVMGMFQGPAANAEVRARLESLDPVERRARLQAVDPAAAMRIHASDVRRTIRALEVFELTGIPITTHQQQWTASPRNDARLFILNWPTPELNQRINARVRAMMKDGLLDEVRGLVSTGELNRQACEALGYKQLLAHLRDSRATPLEDAVERIKIDTRRFAKNQRTWIKRMGALESATTLDAQPLPASAAVEQVIETLGIEGVH